MKDRDSSPAWQERWKSFGWTVKEAIASVSGATGVGTWALAGLRQEVQHKRQALAQQAPQVPTPPPAPADQEAQAAKPSSQQSRARPPAPKRTQDRPQHDPQRSQQGGRRRRNRRTAVQDLQPQPAPSPDFSDHEDDSESGEAERAAGRPPISILNINGAGLNDSTKRRALFAWIRQQHVDFTCITETHLTSKEAGTWWSKGWAGGAKTSSLSFWTTSPSVHSGGVAILVRPGLAFSPSLVEEGTDGRWLRVAGAISGHKVVVTAVYAPADATERAAWLSAAPWSQPAEVDQLGLLCGDFNCVEDPELDTVRRPTYSNAGGAATARVLAAGGWRDAWRAQRRLPDAAGMTLWRGAQGSRIDRTYVSPLGAASVRKVEVISCPVSDHLGLRTQCDGEGPLSNSYSKCFTANREVADSPEGRAAVQAVIALTKSQQSWQACAPGERWSALKAAMCDALRTVAQARAQRRRGAKHATLQECDNLVARLPDPNAAAALAEAKVAAEEAAMEAARGQLIRCRCKWLAEGERCSRYFLSLEKARRAPPGELAVLSDSGEEIRSRTKVARAVRGVWGEIFAEPAASDTARHDEEQQCRRFLSAWPKQVPQAAAEAAKAPIQLEEATEVLLKMRKAAAPGPDGLPVGVYVNHWDAIGPDWMAMVEEAEAIGSLPQCVSAGRLVLLAKGSERVRSPAANRPITLLNSDYKLLTAVLTKRLNPVMSHLVHELQTGFIRGRYIGDNVVLIRDYIESCKAKELERSLIFCDFEKAYDRVRWRWLWRVMEHVGLDGRLLALIQACYANPCVTVVLEGMTLGLLHPTRGVRQGCPMSPLLFALAIEPLHNCLRSASIQGVGLPTTLEDNGSKRSERLKAALFADDITLFPADESDAVGMVRMIKKFGLASGSKLNIDKTVVLLTRFKGQEKYA